MNRTGSEEQAAGAAVRPPDGATAVTDPEAWSGSFWSAVYGAHARFLRRDIDQAALFAALDQVHRSAPHAAGAGPARPFPMGEATRRFALGYDSVMYWPALNEYFGHSDFVNFGYWDGTARDARGASEALMDRLLALIPEKRGRVLDVACGKGATSRHLQRVYAPAAITGINISERQLATCRANAPGSVFMKMDATDLQFPAGSFDDILCVEAAFHFRTRERFFREAHRVLRPGGRLVLCDMLLTEEAETRRPGRCVENYLPDLEAYAGLAQATGFGDVEVTDVSRECFDGAFWHLVRFSHERLLAGEMTPDDLKAFCGHIFAFVPDFRFYLLASLRKT